MTTAAPVAPTETPAAPDFTGQHIDLKAYREAKPTLAYAPRETTQAVEEPPATPVVPVVTDTPTEPVEAPEPAPTAPIAERWTHPQTGEVLDMRTRRAKQIKALWTQLEDAQRENASLRARVESPREPSPSPSRPTAVPPTRPKPTEDQVGSQYQTYGEFVEDLADWKVEQRDAARARIDAETQQQQTTRQMLTAYHDSAVAARARYADFDAVTSRLLPVQLPLDHPVVLAVLQSPVNADLSYALSSRPEEYARIARLPIARALVELGHLEAQVKASLTAPPAPVPTNTTPLPAPMAPVGGNATPTAFSYATATLEQIRAHRKANGGRY